jgi:hypothetical protein
MKLIELQIRDTTYFINPAQITQAVSNKGGISITLNERTESGAPVRLVFEGDEAKRLFRELHSLA